MKQWVIASIFWLGLGHFLLAATPVKLLYSLETDGKISPSSEWIVEMIVEAGQQKGLEVVFDGVQWSRGLELVQSGVADGIINASYKTDRAAFAVYPMKEGIPDVSKSLKAPAYHFYKKRGSAFDFDGKKLIHADGKIGAIRSFAVVDNLKELGADIHLGVNQIGNLRSVAHGELIATAELEHSADQALADDGELAQSIEKLPIPVRKKEYYLIFSKPFYAQREKDAQAIWDGIEKLKNSPKYVQRRSQQP